jgi:N utilization substance protein A
MIKELNGEKVEIILWDSDISKYVINSLSPATGKTAVMDERKKEAIVIADDSQLFLAIGKRGQNVRLASKLTGWNIRVLRESEYLNAGKPAIAVIEGIDDKTAVELAKFGYSSIKALAEADAEELKKIPAIEDEKAEELVNKAKKYREKMSEEKPAEKEAEPRKQDPSQ